MEHGRRRAEAEGLTVTFQEADAEALPFADASFDVVLSTFDVMFASDQEKAASELRRVCRPGGQIGLANWTPDGLTGQVFKTISKCLPPPGVRSPGLWGSKPHLETLFGPGVSIAAQNRNLMFRYKSAAHWVEIYRTYNGPVMEAFAKLDATAGRALEADLVALLESANLAKDGTLVAPAEYLEVVVTKKG